MHNVTSVENEIRTLSLVEWERVTVGGAVGDGDVAVVTPRTAIESDDAIRSSVESLRNSMNRNVAVGALVANFPAPTAPQDRGRSAAGQAIRDLRALLDLADGVGARLVIVRPISKAGAPRLARQEEESLAHYIECFLECRFYAESKSIPVAFDVTAADFLATPTAAREFIDACNSCWIRGHLSISAFGDVAVQVDGEEACDGGRASLVEWMEILGRRVVSVAGTDGELSAYGRRLPRSITEQLRITANA